MTIKELVGKLQMLEAVWGEGTPTALRIDYAEGAHNYDFVVLIVQDGAEPVVTFQPLFK